MAVTPSHTSTMISNSIDGQTADILWIDWDGEGDPENPKNWPHLKKWAATVIVSSFTFISPVSSSMVAPATMQIAQEFGVTNKMTEAMITSVFILGYVIGPLIFGPLSEIYGRSKILQSANLFYLAWNTACSFARNEHQLIAFRLLAGIGGGAPLAIGGAVLGDIWPLEKRGGAIAIYSLAPFLGPVIAPICGGWLAERSTWRWVFWSTSIVGVIIQTAGFVFLRETFAPYLLEGKASRIQKSIDLDIENVSKHKRVQSIHTDLMKRSWKQIFTTALTRPYVMFIQEPIMQVLGICMALAYGLIYLYITTIPRISTKIYHETIGISGLHYIALGMGVIFACQMNVLFADKVYTYLKDKNGGKGEPEFRLPMMVPGSLLVPLGLFLSGWSAEAGLHWILNDIGLACVGAGVIFIYQSVQVYIVDSYMLHTASALAVLVTLRSCTGFTFPLFAPALYEHLGYGKGDTILALFAISISWPAPILFWKYGKAIRMKSKYSQHQKMPAQT